MKTTRFHGGYITGQKIVDCTRSYGKVGENPGDPGWLGSPIVIGKECPRCGQTHMDAAATLPCHRLYLIDKVKNAEWRKAAVKACAGNSLKCVCPDGSPCHTDTLVKMVEAFRDKE